MAFDALALSLFFDDLEAALETLTKPLLPRASFKAWEESYRALRHSPAALESVRYQVNSLSGIEKHRDHFFPRAEHPRAVAKGLPNPVRHSVLSPV